MADDRRVITVTESIHVARAPESVFDYTQDFERRTEWDKDIAASTTVAQDPRSARVTIPNLGSMTVVYKLDRRPVRTSAAFEDVDSRWITGGGGSWEYEAVEGGTRWQQTNSLELKPGWLTRLFASRIEGSLRKATQRSMAEAKRRLEAEATGNGGSTSR